ncbi:hypothetical protein AZE42_09923 [Rhizopogon vesiculosus]|uniref:Major facilitator superfamily (MFS) profile domain-containing protein n=1 Tax=Rhizopogon vesiculosus TaxID=180088 RepID=A0A1J8QFZ3_9AGAM|nr:hypothetical protein AZE42_09923 [Rhizopogon vesiculosus]
MRLESKSSSAVLRFPKHAGLTLSTKDIDTGAQLIAESTSALDPEEALRVRIQFMDKTALGSAAILGIQEATHLTANHINLCIWAITLACHAAYTNFVGLVVVRLLLGASEGSITAGFLIASSMFYTRTEQTLRVGYWFLMNGVAQIISGLISFGVLHIKTAANDHHWPIDVDTCYIVLVLIP